MRAIHVPGLRRRYLLLPVVAALLLIAIGAPALAQSPLPSEVPVSTAAPGVSVAPSGAASASAVAGSATPPCPNPTPAPPTPAPSLLPGQTPIPAATYHQNLCPAQPSTGDPFSWIAWVFTPIFQAIFMVLVVFYNIAGDIGIAIILTTLLIRLILIPIYRRQIVSQRRQQLLQPEIKAISQKYKGDRQKISQEQMRLYQERGYSPASGCLPTLLTLVLLFPMYAVFTAGLSAANIDSMLTVFGVQVIDVTCQPGAATGAASCLNPYIWWLGNLNASVPQISFMLPVIGFGVSILAIISALLQLVQTRMMTPATSDPQMKAQQRTFLLLPLLSVVYGSFLPAGLFIYWIVTTIFSIVQQYLIAGWGSIFPLFGWTPSFALGHTPRFAITEVPPVRAPAKDGGEAAHRSAADSAAGTVRPNKQRARTSRRGRRR